MMALNAYLRLAGKTQGKIVGPVRQTGRDDAIEVFGWNHEVIVPGAASDVVARGRRQHKALVITKALDMTTPLLWKALITNETITSFTLECWRFASDGSEEPYYRIELENATITGIATEQLNNQEKDNSGQPVREHVTFIYEKIRWTWLESGVTTEDSLTTRSP